jgi:bacterioferritin (cytochrome b1)
MPQPRNEFLHKKTCCDPSTVLDALTAYLSNDSEQRNGATAFLKHCERSDPTYREILARILVDELKPV